MVLNSHSPIPLYRQLAERIRSDIEAGRFVVDSRIPSENEMAERYSIGRPTVRQATDMLVRQGLVERRRGSGTFVLPPTRSLDLFSLAGTSAALRKSDLDTTLDVIVGPVREDAVDARNAGGNSPIEQAVRSHPCFRIERKAKADGVPVLYETLWFDANLFAGLENRSVKNQSLSTMVREVFFLEPTSADQTFFVITADDVLAEKLEVEVGSPLLRVQRQLHFGEHRAALFAEIVCRTDCFEFSQTLYPTRAEKNDFNSTAKSATESKST